MYRYPVTIKATYDHGKPRSFIAKYGESASVASVELLSLSLDSAQEFTVTLSLPTGKSITIDWGDGEQSSVSGPVTEEAYSNSYASDGSYTVTFIGDYVDLTSFKCYEAGMIGTLANFVNLTSLETLDLQICYNLTGNVSDISEMTTLTHIDFYSCSSLTCDLSDFADMVSLTYLELLGVGGRTGSLSDLEVLTELEWLGLQDGFDITGNVSSLGGLSKLKHLELERCSGITGDISGLNGATALEWLDLSYISSDDVFHPSSLTIDLADLSSLTNLISFTGYHSTNITGGLHDLKNAPNLTYVNLNQIGGLEYVSTTLPNWAADWSDPFFTFRYNSLSEGEVDDLICDLAATNSGSATVDLRTGNSSPSATGVACKSTLAGTGFDVYTS